MRNFAEDERLKWLADGNAKQARKRIAAKVLVRDQCDRILLVNPTYKKFWDIPGGMVEANESPSVAAGREIAEEIGLSLNVQRVLSLDWVAPHGPWDDQLVFVFDGGVLTDDVIGELRPTDSEISELRFFSIDEATRLLRADVAERLVRAVGSLESDRTHYVETSQADHWY